MSNNVLVNNNTLPEYSTETILQPDNSHRQVVHVGNDVVISGMPVPTALALRYEYLGDVGGVLETLVGESLAGALESASAWRIKKIQDDSGDLAIKWAEGDSSFSYAWDDRATYTYS